MVDVCEVGRDDLGQRRRASWFFAVASSKAWKVSAGEDKVEREVMRTMRGWSLCERSWTRLWEPNQEGPLHPPMWCRFLRLQRRQWLGGVLAAVIVVACYWWWISQFKDSSGHYPSKLMTWRQPPPTIATGHYITHVVATTLAIRCLHDWIVSRISGCDKDGSPGCHFLRGSWTRSETAFYRSAWNCCSGVETIAHFMWLAWWPC